MTFLEDIQVLKKAMDNLFYKVSKKTDLAVNEIRLLLFLHQNKELDIASEIVENLMISKSHVSYTVEKLKNKGYIIKVQDEKDKKKFHLKLTEKADNILKIIKSEQNKLNDISFKDITENEKKQFIQTFNKILNNTKNLKN
ncbi:MAG: MarR family winged helix-turn-helix transcriptional regulator [Clostridia bacterium]|nr:winged helix DNA-binding protein [Clostridium sp.]